MEPRVRVYRGSSQVRYLVRSDVARNGGGCVWGGSSSESSQEKRRKKNKTRKIRSESRIDREENGPKKQKRNEDEISRRNSLSRSRSLALTRRTCNRQHSPQPDPPVFYSIALFVPRPSPRRSPASFGPYHPHPFPITHTRLPNLSNCTRLTCYVPPCYSISVPTQTIPPRHRIGTLNLSLLSGLDK